MSHEIESMAYTGEAPWHKLGTRIDHLMTAEEAIKAAGLDWTVSLEDCYVKRDGSYNKVEEHFAVSRDTDKRIYGITGKRYVPLQNKDAFKFFDLVVGTGEAHYETAGSLKNGAIIWVLAAMNGSIGVKGEEVKRYLTLTNGHGGLTAAQMFHSPVRVVCWNTLNMALSKATDMFYARHTLNIMNKVDAAKEVLGYATKFYDDWSAKANAMALKQLPPAQMPLLLAAAFQTSGAMPADKIYAPTLASMNKVKELVEVGRGMNNPAIKGTIWQAYNAVAEFADYERTYRKDNSPDKRLYAAWFGSSASLKQRAWDWCVKAL